MANLTTGCMGPRCRRHGRIGLGVKTQGERAFCSAECLDAFNKTALAVSSVRQNYFEEFLKQFGKSILGKFKSFGSIFGSPDSQSEPKPAK